MKTERELIQGLRRRKPRLAAYTVMALTSGVGLVISLILYFKVVALIQALANTNANSTIKPNALLQGMPQLVSAYAYLSVCASRSFTLGILTGGALGLSIAMITLELSGQTKDRLLIAMWDELQQLKEQRVEPGAPGVVGPAARRP